MKKSKFTLNDWLLYIQNLHNKFIDLNLRRMFCIAKKLKLFHPASYIITVGGTNGKGTTCRLLEMILLRNGQRVGVYSSPHILKYTERVRIQGKELSNYLHILAMSVIESARDSISLTYFEFSTLSALWLFKQEKLDIIILEVGLGGRFDATNIVDSDISVITNVAIDHTNFLGFRIDSIAYEKSGIFRFQKIAIFGDCNRPKIIDFVAKKTGSILYSCNNDWFWKKIGGVWKWYDKTHSIDDLPIPDIPIENAATALAVIRCIPLKVLEKNIRSSLQKVKLPGRFQCIQKNPLIILDVAHNPHAANYLAYKISCLKCTGKIRAVVGMLRDKDIFRTLSIMKKKVSYWYSASLHHYRSANKNLLAYYLDKNSKTFNSIIDAFYEANTDSDSDDCIIVFGSFHAIAPILSLNKIKIYLCN